MTTTIQVDEKTLKMLAALKKEFKANSYQEVIQLLASKKRGVPGSLFGYLKKGARPFNREPEDEHAL